MSRITPLKPGEVISRLRKFGFEGPVGGGKDVSVGLIREIINEIGISREEWLEL